MGRRRNALRKEGKVTGVKQQGGKSGSGDCEGERTNIHSQKKKECFLSSPLR